MTDINKLTIIIKNIIIKLSLFSGLTVTLSRDSATGDYALEAGALVLADQGMKNNATLIYMSKNLDIQLCLSISNKLR